MTSWRQIQALRKIFRALDKKISVFQKRTGLDCLRGCGWCCENHEVETTVLEMMPLAWELWRKGKAASWMQKAQEVQASGRCIFYRPRRSAGGKGRCAVHAFRPLICRAFGFGCIPDKNGSLRLVTCALIKNARRATYQAAEALINKGLTAVDLTDYTTRIICLDPALATERMPINTAAAKAIERLGLQKQLRRTKDNGRGIL